MQRRKSGRGRPRTLTLAAMCAHVNRLIEAANARRPPDDALKVEWVSDRNALRVIGNEFNLLRLPIINDARDYPTALHELGQLLGPYQTSRNMLTRERWAWEWSRTTALQWTEEMKAEAMEALAALPQKKTSMRSAHSLLSRGGPVSEPTSPIRPIAAGVVEEVPN